MSRGPLSGQARARAGLSGLPPCGGPLATRWPGGQSDPYKGYDELLLPMRGTHGGSVFGDQSWRGRGVVRSGTPQTTTAQSLYYGSSGDFGGRGCLSVSTDTAISLAGEWCIDVAVRHAGAAGWRGLVSKRLNNVGWTLCLSPDHKMTAWSSAYGAVTGSVVVPAATWTRLRWVRAAGVLSMFVEGEICATTTNAFPDNTNPLWVGASESDREFFEGYLQDLRVTIGSARGAGAPTSPTPLLGRLPCLAAPMTSTTLIALQSQSGLLSAVARVGAAGAWDPLLAPRCTHDILLVADGDRCPSRLLASRVVPI